MGVLPVILSETEKLPMLARVQGRVPNPPA